jgi:hypothetical protein
MKFYYLCRKEDVSHTSGTGHVAEIAEFDDGAVVVRWLASSNATGIASTSVFQSLDELLRVHGHEGKTVAEPVVDCDHVARLEGRCQKLERSLSEAVALLEQNRVPVAEDLRTQRDQTPLPAPACALNGNR